MTLNTRINTIFSRWLPILLWAIVIFFASANSNPYKPLPVEWLEPCFSTEPDGPSCTELLGRALHAGEYAVLAALTTRGLIWKGEMRPILLGVSWSLSAFYALSDEIHQLFVPGRTFQLLDLALDIGGGLIGLMVFVSLRIIMFHRKGITFRHH